MPAEPACAPFALAARQVDLACDAAAQPLWIFTGDDFAHELVSGCSAESIVTALQVKIGRTDPSRQQTNARKAFGNARKRLAADFDAAGFKVDTEHCNRLLNTAR